MAQIFGGNWACNIIGDGMKSRMPAARVAAILAQNPRFIAAIERGMKSDQPNVPGGAGEEHAVGNLVAELTVPGELPDGVSY